jgi:EAL domain-containing protein (putative c-di-GMP-specific phosphodiesterase class I)/ActR/RegA family two-component response regulator
MNNRRVLILDDDAELREFTSLVIAKEGFEILALENFSTFKNRIIAFQPDLIILDLSLGDTDGVEVLRYLSGQNSKASVLLISSFDERLLKSALTLGDSYGLNMLGNLQKPLKPSDLRAILARLPEVSANVRENDLDDAIQQDLMFLNFQPKVDMRSRQVLSAEALVRLNDPKRGLVFPDQFIHLAEQSGLIKPMTERILHKALVAARAWRDAGTPIAVAVNLSARSLTDLEFPNRIGAMLRDAQVDPSQLILEVTETSAMTDTKVTMDILTRLRIKGIHISLDDFGTGYSSLVELHRMPFSELKIDRSFVMNSDRDKDSRIIVEAILGLAHAMKIKVVAEGVESKAHWELLVGMGCDMAQGYYLAKPLPFDDFNRWVGDWSATYGKGSNSLG